MMKELKDANEALKDADILLAINKDLMIAYNDQLRKLNIVLDKYYEHKYDFSGIPTGERKEK